MNCAQHPSTTGAVIFCVILGISVIYGMWALNRAMERELAMKRRLRRMRTL